jgi:hypothetical protein
LQRLAFRCTVDLSRRSLFKTFATLPALAAVPAMAQETDDTAELAAAFKSPEALTLEARTYRVHPDVLRIETAHKRIVGPCKAGVTGGAVIEAIGGGKSLLSIVAHGAVIEGVTFSGAVDILALAKREPVAWGDLDAQFVGCTFLHAKTGVYVHGRGAFFDRCWFSHNDTHIAFNFPGTVAPPNAHWNTPQGGARKYVVNGCYFHHGSSASIAVYSPLAHGLQVIGCHHDATQPFIAGRLIGSTVTGNSIYRLRGVGIRLVGKSADSTITGNTFAGDRGESKFPTNKMTAAVYVEGSAENFSITGNVRSCGRGPIVTVAGRVVDSVISGNACGKAKAVQVVGAGKLVRTRAT